jgi:primosomal protein N' (replication factor Y)
MFCTVVTASKSPGIGGGLTYETDETLYAGSAVRVPLRNTFVEGIVLDVTTERAKQEYDFKKISDVLSRNPMVSEAALRTAQWMAEEYFCSLRMALSVWLPASPWSSVLPKDIVGYYLKRSDTASIRGKKQQAVVEYVMGKEWVSREVLRAETGATSSVIAALLERGVLAEERRKEDVGLPLNRPSPLRSEPILTPAQEAVYESIKQDMRPTLLFGITGSGKTEIYAKLIADAVRQGKQAMLLLPEILLTEHFIDRFQALLDRDSIAVVHSRLTPAERRELWKRIHQGAISLVIGSRSALFSPLRNLAVVVVDEEHEWTYKNEQTPRYHVRATAEVLCRNAGATLVFGTATPSLEAWSRAKSGRYHLARLPMRYKEQALPDVKVVDLAEVQFGTLYPFSPTLIEAIRVRLERKEQTVLFLNRRGVASALLCMQCRRRVISPESQLPFTLHHTRTGRPYLLDHTSGVIAEVPSECPHCKSPKLNAVGAGTQRIEILLEKLFPKARLLRADADTIQEPEEMRSLLWKMRNNEADILLGTQSVVKGLDLPNVTLAAVLIADVGLSLPHFRAGERIFQLLTQLTGRSGRAKAGEVIIQTFRPEALEVAAASKHETEKYMENELKIRSFSGYPPFTRMIRLLFRDDDAEAQAKKAQAAAVKLVLQDGSDVRVSVSPTFFGGGKVWQVLMRGADPAAIVRQMDQRTLSVDVDPMETM